MHQPENTDTVQTSAKRFGGGWCYQELRIFCVQNLIQILPFIWPGPAHIRSAHSCWSNVNQKAQVIENTLKTGPLVIQVFFGIQNMIWIFSRIQSLSSLVRLFSHKKLERSVGIILIINKQTGKHTPKHDLLVEVNVGYTVGEVMKFQWISG